MSWLKQLLNFHIYNSLNHHDVYNSFLQHVDLPAIQPSSREYLNKDSHNPVQEMPSPPPDPLKDPTSEPLTNREKITRIQLGDPDTVNSSQWRS